MFHTFYSIDTVNTISRNVQVRCTNACNAYTAYSIERMNERMNKPANKSSVPINRTFFALW